MLNPPFVTPNGTIMLFGTEATEGLLLVTWNVVSVDCGEAMLTVAKELPPRPTVEVGDSVSAVGCGCGRSVSTVCALVPFQLAVKVAVVGVATVLVCSGKKVEKEPAGTVTVGGGVTAMELLDRLTTAPPAGAWPFSITVALDWAPPLIVLGETDTDCNEGGSTVSWREAVLPFSVAERVTGVAAVTCPVWIVNWVQAVLAGMLTEAGSGTTLGFELASAIGAPPAPTAEVSCTAIHVPSPL